MWSTDRKLDLPHSRHLFPSLEKTAIRMFCFRISASATRRPASSRCVTIFASAAGSDDELDRAADFPPACSLGSAGFVATTGNCVVMLVSSASFVIFPTPSTEGVAPNSQRTGASTQSASVCQQEFWLAAVSEALGRLIRRPLSGFPSASWGSCTPHTSR